MATFKEQTALHHGYHMTAPQRKTFSKSWSGFAPQRAQLHALARHVAKTDAAAVVTVDCAHGYICAAMNGQSVNPQVDAAAQAQLALSQYIFELVWYHGLEYYTVRNEYAKILSPSKATMQSGERNYAQELTICYSKL
jgi:hypothetical protein